MARGERRIARIRRQGEMHFGGALSEQFRSGQIGLDGTVRAIGIPSTGLPGATSVAPVPPVLELFRTSS